MATIKLLQMRAFTFHWNDSYCEERLDEEEKIEYINGIKREQTHDTHCMCMCATFEKRIMLEN